MNELSFPYNKEILIYLNSLLENDLTKELVHILSDWPIFFLPIFLILAWLIWNFKWRSDKKKWLLFIFYSTVFAIAINILLQQFFDFERPENICKLSWELILNHIPDASFPSDHAAVSFAFLTALFLANYKKTFIFFSFFVILMNLSRIIWCVHWPYDILFWAFIWIFSAFFTFKILKKINFSNNLNEFIIKIMHKIGL